MQTLLISLLLIVASFTQNLMAQVEPPQKQAVQEVRDVQPSKKEIQAQIATAKRDALTQVAVIERDIATAKTNNEDPAVIKEMENQLATMKKMLGVIEKARNAGNAPIRKLPPSKKVEPKYTSPFVPVTLKQRVTAPKKDQANDQLLWYTGRRINSNTLITTSATVVQYDRVNSRVVVQPERRVDSPGIYYGMVNTLAQTPQMKNEFAITMDGIENSFFMYPEIQKAYDEYDFFKNRYYKIAKNVITIGRPTVTRMPRPDQVLEAMHHDLIIKMATLPSPYNIKVPPKRPNDLCQCDPAARADYEQNLVNWLESAFWTEEELILHRLKEIYGQLDLRQQIGLNAPAPIPNFKQDIINAFKTVIERITIKLNELDKKYEGPDIYLEEGLVMATMSFKKMLMQTIADMPDPSIVQAKSNAYALTDHIEHSILNNTVFEKYMNDEKVALNYNIIFDYSLYLAHEYNKKLMNPSYQLKENFFNTWIEGMKNFNRFTLTLSMNFQYTQTDETNNVLLDGDGKLESKPVIVSLGRSTCSWNIYPADVNHKDKSGNEEPFQIEISVQSGIKKIYMAGGKTIPYSGPGKMRMVFPTFEISFCPGRNNDLAMMDVLRYSDIDLQRHRSDRFDKVYTTDMLQYANKMFLGFKEIKDNTYDITGIAGDMLDIASGSVPLPPSCGNQNMDNILMNHYMNEKKRDAQLSLAQSTHTANTSFQFDAQNKSSVFVDKTHSTVDSNDKDKIWGIKFTVGEVTMKIVHTPKP